MLHFFVNSGIRDTTYYWSELTRLVNVYYDVKEVCPDLDTLDIGGGMPIYTSLGVEHDYAYMIDQIVYYIKTICESRNCPGAAYLYRVQQLYCGRNQAVPFTAL